VTLSRTGFDTNIFGGRFSKAHELLTNEHVGFFALLSSGHGPLLRYSQGRYGPMSTHTECVERRMCTGDSSLSCMSVKIDIHSLRVL